jgi:hypothetical protein
MKYLSRSKFLFPQMFAKSVDTKNKIIDARTFSIQRRKKQEERGQRGISLLFPLLKGMD